MATTFGGRLKHAVNAFTNRENERAGSPGNVSRYGASFGSRPDRVRYRTSNDRSIISAIYTRIVIDIAMVNIYHVRRDDQKRYSEDINSGLNNCLNLEANLDQSAFDFKMDMIWSLFDEGCIAVVPIDTDINPMDTDGAGGYDIQTMRVGKIVDWSPEKILVNVYNQATGRREEIWVKKRNAAVVTNPLYAVMNESNSTLQRLTRKLSLLDTVDEASSSGKLDIIIQLPYAVKSEAKRQQAEQRRKDIEWQLKGSQYGIAYTDGTEKITQLNRSAENNLLKQVEYLTEQLYSYLGITPAVMNGSASEPEMLNYMDRTVEPILEAFAGEFRRKFLTKTGRTQGQWIEYFKDPFKLVPMSILAEIADKLTRNEIVTSNEFRGIIGMRPSSDPKADELRNSNIPREKVGFGPSDASGEVVDEEEDVLGASLDELDTEIDATLVDLGVPDDVDG